MKWLFVFLITCSFYDPELQLLWDSIADINHPTREDYKKIETYLQEGKRPYLDLFKKNRPQDWRLLRMRSMQLLGPKGEMPTFEIYKGTHPHRCILLFASYNSIYPDKARNLLSQLQKCGYEGDILLRIGGFPHTPHGGLRWAHIPYSFKAAFLKEAQTLGYQEVLWIDLALHPLANLDLIFNQIKERGYFFTYVSSLEGNAPSNLEEAALALGIKRDQYDQIPHISSSMIGLNFSHEKAKQLLDTWISEMEKVYPNITWFPEELSLSVTAWRLHLTPYSWFGTISCLESQVADMQHHSRYPQLQFYLDSKR